jgi:hypothetical protein
VEVQREWKFRARGFEKWLARTLALQGKDRRKSFLVWVQEARHIVILVGERGVGVYIATRVRERM